jgi:hypothetical protein
MMIQVMEKTCIKNGVWVYYRGPPGSAGLPWKQGGPVPFLGRMLQKVIGNIVYVARELQTGQPAKYAAAVSE